MADEFKKEDILELEAEVDEDAINIPAEVPLTKNEALALIVYKMHQKGQRKAYGLGHGAQRDRSRIRLSAQLHHQADPVLGFGRKQHESIP